MSNLGRPVLLPCLRGACHSSTPMHSYLRFSSARAFSTIQRGHDKQVESLFEKLGFGKDKEVERVRRTLSELEQGFVRQVQLLRDPLHDPKDKARLERLKEAYLLLRDENFRRNYAAHAFSSNDAALHVLVDGGAVAANFNPEHQSFEFINHSALRTDGAMAQAESLNSNSDTFKNAGGSGGRLGSPSASTSFASTQAAYQEVTGTGPSAAPYNAADAKAPQHGADIPFLLKLSFEESLLGCSRPLQLQKHTQCPACKGNGTQTLRPSSKARSCPQCMGRGSVHLPSATYHIDRKCNHCGGEGTMPPPRCTRCRGRGVLLDKPQTVSVAVPPGAFTGTVFRLLHKGHDGVRGGRAGDLVVTIMAVEHRHFSRVGNDLHAMLPLPLSTALLGGVVQVPSLLHHHHHHHHQSQQSKKTKETGSTAGMGAHTVASLRVPPCSRNGQVLGLRQYEVRSTDHDGSSSTSSGIVGNIYYHVLVLIPKSAQLSGRQRAALAAYENATGHHGSGSEDSASPDPQQAQEDDAGATESSRATVEQQAHFNHCASLKQQYKHWFTN